MYAKYLNFFISNMKKLSYGWQRISIPIRSCSSISE